ncbi:MFS general substrate transporter [Gymnopus androsaceus JB14]|uniref:MFS general substrate transporter n=1 Tax=Gymnopus androsaceus JB14 TaxID=1447944 RepID=A0A6A4IPX3_9AGAR|nr:MFS general substrate transporter [Gymnopus androsaceus JB14]
MTSDRDSSTSIRAEPKSANATSYMLRERRVAALAEVDNAKFSSFHVKVCFVAGAGFFTDAYDIFAISIAATMLGYVYNSSGSLTSSQNLAIKVATPVGNLVGQLLFGWLADVVGRKKMYGLELMLIIFSTFAQALSANGPSVLHYWCSCHLAFPCGDYPLSAVISSEFASTRTRGRLMTAVFAFQGWGSSVIASIVACIVVAAYKDSILNDVSLTDSANVSLNSVAVDKTWRILIGMGCIPGVIALYYRLTIPETPRFTMDIERNIQQASKDIEDMLAINKTDVSNEKVDVPVAGWSDFTAHFGQWKNMKVLIGTSYSWFALDIAFFGLGLNSSIILEAIGFGNGTGSGSRGVYQTLLNVSIGNLILSIAGYVPGYWASFYLIDSWGRKPIQLMGFTLFTLYGGFAYDKLLESDAGRKAFVFLYCLANFFENFGPNTTTFIVPGEVFPTRYRSTAHGISAASGKLGAVISQVGFAALQNTGGKNKFLGHLLEILAFFMLTGIFSTLLIPETKGKSLEELSPDEK